MDNSDIMKLIKGVDRELERTDLSDKEREKLEEAAHDLRNDYVLEEMFNDHPDVIAAYASGELPDQKH